MKQKLTQMLKLKQHRKLRLNNSAYPIWEKVNWRGSFFGAPFFLWPALGALPPDPQDILAKRMRCRAGGRPPACDMVTFNPFLK